MPKLAILGCGYVGRAVLERALACGWQVSTLTRNPETAASLRALGAAVIEAELDSASWHGTLDPEQDMVLNCVSSAGGGLPGYEKSYVNGMRSLSDWAARGKVGTVVYTSATSVYPQSDGSWVTEASSTEGASPNGQYLLQSEAVLAAAPVGRWFTLRLAGIYGLGRHFFLDRLRAGETHFSGSPDTYLNLIFLEDIVSAIEAVFASGLEVRNRIYNLADGNPAPRGEMLRWLAQEVGSAAPTFEAELAGKRDAGRRSAAGAMPNRRVSIERIGTEYGWQPKFKDYQAGFTHLLQS
ncbi:MAG: NAD-dependent epimerase/dehydratase family protein [Verrucomicrobiota bacterium]